MTDQHDNLLLSLQTAVAGAREELPRLHLRKASRDINASIEAFNREPNTDNLRVLNGAWAAGVRTLDRYAPQKSIA